jgi:hypothetical protein
MVAIFLSVLGKRVTNIGREKASTDSWCLDRNRKDRDNSYKNRYTCMEKSRSDYAPTEMSTFL